VNVLCPACSGRMDKYRFPLDPPLEIERCGRCHGILLDFEEIRRIPAVGKWAAARAQSKS
jgi:Zn-finger nucleic acid-binding protein